MASIYSLANQIARTVRGGYVNSQNTNVEIDISASHSSCNLIGQLKRKPSESCQKDVKYRRSDHAVREK